MKTTITHRSTKVLVICIVSLLLANASGNADECFNNFVSNGSFESGLAPGWVLSSGSIDVVSGSWVPGDGNVCIDLTGGTAGTISQVISGFSPGQTYSLSFLLAGNPGAGPTVKTLQASIGGVSRQYSFNVSGFSATNMGWTLNTLDFTAPGPTVTLIFASLTDGGAGPALDKVVITPATPEITQQPTSQFVMIGGNVNFLVKVTGSAPFSYQWRKDALAVVGQSGPSLSLVNLQSIDMGSYDVVASNTFGVVTSQVAKLTIVSTGTPEIQADGEPLIEDVIRGDLSTVSMFTAFPNGTIFYTTDGSAPNFASEPYQGPFVITQSTRIWAIAYNVDFTQSAQVGLFQIQIVPSYALTASVIGQGMVQACQNRPRYAFGTTVALSAYPAAGWRFARWQGAACGGGGFANVVMDTNKTVTAVFVTMPTYPLIVTTAGGGTILGNTDTAYPEGSVVNLSAQPASGWQFLRWQGDVSGTTPNVSVIMDRAMNIQAVFGTSVATTAGGSGSLFLNPADGPYPYGSAVRFSARPAIGSYFAVWGSAASGRANPLNFVVTNANPTVSALFAPLQGSDVNVYVNVVGEGTVSASPNPQPYSPGTSVTLTATPSSGWRFVQWQGDASGTSTNATVVLNVSKTVTAVFQVLPRFTLTTTTPGGGFIAGNMGSPYVDGDVVNLTAQPASGWQFLGWHGDAGGTTPNVAVTMDRAKNVQAVFGTLLITNVVGPGTVTLSPAQGPYPYGSMVRLTATPSPGFYFNLWGNSASSMENPLDYVVTTANPAICALFGPTGTTQSPAITVQPVSQSVIAGGTATFQVTAAGTTPLTYQWRKEGVPIGGAMASTYALFGVTTNDAGSFDVVVSNTYGSITSAVVTLTVVFPPSITVQPASTVVASGDAATFNVVAGGTEPFSYQWHNSAGPIPGATNAIYTLDPALTNHAGNFVVVVSNPYGVATSQVATLTVYVLVSITSQPAQQVVPFRGTASFSAHANGHPAPYYQWLFNGGALTGANDSNLVITNVSTNALGGYSVIAWNAYSAATSSVAMLLMSPSIRSPFLGATVIWGKSATLSASAVGSGELSYQWFKDGAPILWGTNSTLEFSAVQISDAGLYSVIVRSVWGSATNAPAQLVVNPANISLAMYAGITIDGVAGYTYGIQYTTDLRNTNAWVTITNVTLSVPVETWIDLESAGKVKRYYRVIAP